MDITTYTLAKKFATQVAAGFSSVSVDNKTSTINFILNDGTEASLKIPVPEGTFVTDLKIKKGNELWADYSNGDSKKIGIIGGGGSGASEASQIFFDNSESGLASDNVQSAIEEVFQSVSNGKELIADAITDKGVETSATDTFAVMAANIESISTGAAELELCDLYGELSPNSYIDYTFTATSSGWLQILLGGRNIDPPTPSNVYINGKSCAMQNTRYDSSPNRFVYQWARVCAGDEIRIYNRAYAGYTIGITCFISKELLMSTSSGTKVTDEYGCCWSFNNEWPSFQAPKDGTVISMSFEVNIGNSGGLWVNNNLTGVTGLLDSGNVHIRYCAANVAEGDTIKVGGNQWYSSSQFTGMAIFY